MILLTGFTILCLIRWRRASRQAVVVAMVGYDALLVGKLGFTSFDAVFLGLAWWLWNFPMVLGWCERLVPWWRRVRTFDIDWYGFGFTRGAFTELFGYVPVQTYEHASVRPVIMSGGMSVFSNAAAHIAGWDPWAIWHPPTPEMYPTITVPRRAFTFPEVGGLLPSEETFRPPRRWLSWGRRRDR